MTAPRIDGATALGTGAIGGSGVEFVSQALERGEPDDVVRASSDLPEAGALEVLADERSRGVRERLSLPIEAARPETVQLGSV